MYIAFRKQASWLLASSLFFFAAKGFCQWTPGKAPLLTRWAADVNPTNVLSEYPRPQLVRAEWLNLNGLWDYTVAPQPEKFTGKILVPFPIESALSGVMQRFDEKSVLWYHREFSVADSWRGRRVLLHFGAVDWDCQVSVNGQKIGGHQGGYDAFTFDVTDALHWSGQEEILISVRDATEGDQPSGKQVRQPQNIFYTPTSGIWQTVWLEPVPENSIDSLRLVPDLKAGGLRIAASVASLSDNLEIEATALINGQEISHVSGAPNATLFLSIPQPHLWSPDDPFLYDLRIVLKQSGREVDRVGSYFGLREIGLKKDSRGVPRIALNGKQIFQLGVLDQGYWPDGLYTAPTDAALRSDLDFLKSTGFNLVRKHQKIEPERWYYWCDKLGLLVWQDMPRANNVSAAGRQEFEIELHRMIDGLALHPSIVQWVLFNEGWGQYDTERLVADIKKHDPTRLIDNASGWTDARVGDVVDTHSYPDPTSIERDDDRAMILGEFGGVGHRVNEHSWSEKSWGYKNEPELQGLMAWYLHLTKQIFRLRDKLGLSAAVYTQLSDVETECNGLLTYDRAVTKIDAETLRSMNHANDDADTFGVILPDAIGNGSSQWRYTFAQPPTTWTQPVFDDSAWSVGIAGFGTPITMGSIVRTLWSTNDIWLRREFVVTNEVSHPMIEIHHDDDAEVYLNGELATHLTGFLVDYTSVEMSDVARRTLHAGTNTIAVHCHQTVGGQYIDVGLIEARARAEP